MLKRSDLVKQFEKVVTQEIKNHNDSILATNQTLDSFRKSLAHLEDQIKKNHAQCISKLGEQSRWPEILRNEVDACLDNLSKKANHTHVRLESLQSNLNVVLKRIINEHAKKEEVISLKKWIDEFATNIENAFKEVAELIDFGVKNVSTNERVKREQFEKKIIESPNHIQKLKDECLRKIDENKVDNEALIKELHLVKKQAFIQEKKIENLYTLIERMKKERS